MPNPYITQVPSYMQQDQQGLMPVFQNVAAQQANMNQQLAQSNQLSQPSMQSSGYSGLNPLAMAMMLRKKDPQGYNGTLGDNTYFNSNSNGMGAGGSADFNQLIGLS